MRFYQLETLPKNYQPNNLNRVNKMAALVRIKRRLDENPLETLVLNCKRRKIDGGEQAKPENVSAVLKLAGTSQKAENIDSLLRKHRTADLSELKDQFKKHPVNINEKIRADMRESSRSSRYRVVNCFRKTLNSEGNIEASTSSSEVTVFDIESDHNISAPSTSIKENPEDMSKYVYDFYYTSSDDFGDADIENYVSVFPLDDPLVFGSIRDNGLDKTDSEDDSEDSNAESNWKNDYPDEEDLESVNEDDMFKAVKNLNIDEDLLSSDSGEEDLAYSREEEDFQDEIYDLDKEDELKYGKKYARFKAKNKSVVTTGLTNDFYYGDIDETEYFY